MLARVLQLALWRAARGTPAPVAFTPEPATGTHPILPPARPKPLAKVIHLATKRRVPPPPAEDAPSAWDPDPQPVFSNRLSNVRTPFEEEMVLQEINGCKTLLLEMVRRAAYDWVLYRASRRLVNRSMAEQAYRWLFTEVPGSADWEERIREGKHITSFVSVCESLDLDPETVRKHIRRLTPKNVMSVGRPAEYRRRDVFSTRSGDDDVYSVPGAIAEYTDAVDDGSDDPTY